jgi:hypothetical protein
MVNLKGKTFTDLYVVSLSKVENGYDYWNTVCSCGNKGVKSGAHLRSGHTKSCGHLRRDVALTVHTTHGMRSTSTYKTWASMLQRCLNKNDARYDDWGGRGISVCKRWVKSFEAFLSDMGIKPIGKSLDRKNNDGNYSPSNCKWSTPKEQSQNRRTRKDSLKLRNTA